MKRFYSFSKLAIFAVAVFVGAYLPSTISLRANGKQASVSLPANISVVNVPSKAMNKTIPTMIVLPSSYDINKTKKYPVLYLLHGFGGNHTSWLRIRPDIQKLASQFEMIIVSPDGFKSSWYWDSPIDPTVKYETFVSKELVEYVDLNYRTNATRKGRAITGLSMGGHGGLWLGFRHQDVYGACGAMSGGVDIRPFPNNWEMAKRLGDASKNADIWEKHTVINQLHLLKPNSIRIAFECGVDDFFYEVNEKLHKELLYRNIPHDYTTRPGRHNSPYWNNALPYQMLFFSNGF